MPRDVFIPWCEWDVGQEGLYFTSPQKAKNWFIQNEHIEDLQKLDNPEMTVEQYVDHLWNDLMGVDQASCGDD